MLSRVAVKHAVRFKGDEQDLQNILKEREAAVAAEALLR